MSLPRSQPRTGAISLADGPRTLGVVNDGATATTATVLLDTGGADPTAYVVRLVPGQSASLPLDACAGRTTVECHLDENAASAVVSVDPTPESVPLLSLRSSSVVVAH